MNKIKVFGKNNVGRLRDNNEDAYIAQPIWNDNNVLAVAIDGVGGYEGGEVAAEIAQKSIVEYLEKYSNGDRDELLRQAVTYANNNIFEKRKQEEKLANMSCVLTAALVEAENGRINMAHVGDTRLYQYFEGELTKLSHDHSLVGYREEIGDLTEEEAMRHPQRNIITRDVGSTHLENNEQEYIEVATFRLMPNSTLLLCSDGLCDMVTSAQMKEVLATDLTIEEKVDQLIDLANIAGGKDNITVVLVEVKGDTIEEQPGINEPIENTEVSQEEYTTDNKNRRMYMRALLIVIIAVAILCIGFGAGFQFGKQQVVSTPIIDTVYCCHTDSCLQDTTATDSTMHCWHNRCCKDTTIISNSIATPTDSID